MTRGDGAAEAHCNRCTPGVLLLPNPFGAVKNEVVGAGTKAGGPNILPGFSSWTDVPATAPASARPDAFASTALAAVDAADRAWLSAALASDAVAWADEFGTARDVSALESEQNVFRYAPVPVTVRFEDAADRKSTRLHSSH